MAHIKITTDLGPWLNDAPLPKDAVVEVSDEVALTFVDKGFAEIVDGKPSEAAPNVVEAEVTLKASK